MFLYSRETFNFPFPPIFVLYGYFVRFSFGLRLGFTAEAGRAVGAAAADGFLTAAVGFWAAVLAAAAVGFF